MKTLRVSQGELEISRDDILSAPFQTCCGIVYYDKNVLKGLAHAVVSTEDEELYRMGAEIPQDAIVTPQQAANRLLEKMIVNGTRDDLYAAIFGCRNDVLGVKNAKEAHSSNR